MKCIFCDIVKGKIKSFRIYEDEKHLAILDIYPNVEGMTVVITKKHHPSYIFSMSAKDYENLFNTAKRVAKMLGKGVGVSRVAMVMEGMGVDHAHLKLYPLHGVKRKFTPVWAKREIFFDKYRGYITTQLGPKADEKKLEKLAKKIRGDKR